MRNSISYPDDPENAITDAFIRTDQAVISKYQTDVSGTCGRKKMFFKMIFHLQSLRSGTTALVVLHFPEDKMMHVAWAGDSQALIVKNGETVQVVNSHKANRKVGYIRFQYCSIDLVITPFCRASESESKRLAVRCFHCREFIGSWVNWLLLEQLGMPI